MIWLELFQILYCHTGFTRTQFVMHGYNMWRFLTNILKTLQTDSKIPSKSGWPCLLKQDARYLYSAYLWKGELFIVGTKLLLHCIYHNMVMRELRFKMKISIMKVISMHGTSEHFFAFCCMSLFIWGVKKLYLGKYTNVFFKGMDGVLSNLEFEFLSKLTSDEFSFK